MSIGRFGPTGLRKANGQPLASTAVTVLVAGTATPASLKTDATGATPLANPVTTDAYGNLTFYVEQGSYDLVVNGGKVTVPVDALGSGGGGGGGGLALVKSTYNTAREYTGVRYQIADFINAENTFTVTEGDPMPDGRTVSVERKLDLPDFGYGSGGIVRPTIPGIYDVQLRVGLIGLNEVARTDPASRPEFYVNGPTESSMYNTTVAVPVPAYDPVNPTVPAGNVYGYGYYHAVPFSGGYDDYDWTDFGSNVQNGIDMSGWSLDRMELTITFTPVLLEPAV